MRRPRFSEANFAYLLAGLLMFLLTVPALHLILGAAESEIWLRLGVAGTFALMILVGIWSVRRDRRLFRIGLRLVILQVVLSILAEVEHLRWLESVARVVAAAFCGLSLLIAGRHVFNFRQVDKNVLFGAVCIYLLLGLIYAILYLEVAKLAPENAFRGIDLSQPSVGLDEFLYFSFVTLTTAGYGDITPLNPLLRTLAYLEMITGQFYMAVLVAGLVGVFLNNRPPP